MLSLPELRLGDRIIRLPLSPLGTVDVANAWLTADAGERHSLWLALLQREPGMALWGALQLPPDVAAAQTGAASSLLDFAEPIARVCEQQLLRAYLQPPAAASTGNLDWERQAIESAIPDAANRSPDASPTNSPRTPALNLPSLAHALAGDKVSQPFADSDLRASSDSVEPAAKTLARSVENEKLAALREFAYGLSHEINNPLANISTRAQSLLREERDVERRRSLSVMAQQAMRAHTMIADLMLFAKPPALRRAPTQPRQIIERLVNELREWARQQGTLFVVPWLNNLESDVASPRHDSSFASDHVAVEDDFASGCCWVSVDGDQLLVALRAIATNSLEALRAGGRIEFSVTRMSSPQLSSTTLAPGATTTTTLDCLRFRVRDSGPGIPPAVRRHLFDPYYSGREAGRGLGVGLCKAWRIATEHGGVIDVVDAPGGGAEFRLDIPAIPIDAPKHT